MQATVSVGAPSIKSYRTEIAFVVGMIAANLLFDFAVENIGMPGWKSALRYDWMRALSPATFPPTMLYEQSTIGFVLGCYCSQFFVLAIWTTLFSGTSFLRLVCGTLIVILLAICARYIFIDVRPTDDWHIITDPLFSTVAFYVVMLPLWLLRRVLQMRISRSQASKAPSQRSRQLTLREILTASLYVALPVLLAKEDLVLYSTRAFTVQLLLLSTGYLLFGIPMLCAMLGTRRFVWGLVIVLLLSELFFYLGCQVYPNLFPGAAAWPRIVVTFRGIQLAILVVTLGNGVAARAMGYRLQASLPWRRSVDRAPHPKPALTG